MAKIITQIFRVGTDSDPRETTRSFTSLREAREVWENLMKHNESARGFQRLEGDAFQTDDGILRVVTSVVA